MVRVWKREGSSVRMPVDCFIFVGFLCVGWFWMRMVPEVGVMRFAARLMVVLLPEPLGPRSANVEPFGTFRFSGCRTVVFWYCLVIFLNCISYWFCVFSIVIIRKVVVKSSNPLSPTHLSRGAGGLYKTHP